MLHHLDATISELLLRELGKSYRLSAANISFAAPDEEFRKAGFTSPTLNLFLYDVRENWELRSNEPSYRRDERGVTRAQPPARVDCSYLITVWSSSGGNAIVADEHALLGDVARVLLRHRRIPAEVLQGDLKGAEPPLRARVIQQGYLQSLGEFWQAMGGRPRAALSYTVTVALDLFPPEELGPPVTEKIIRIAQGSEEP